MSKRKIIWLVVAVAMVSVFSGAGFLYWRAAQRHDLAVNSLPKNLNLDGKRTELVARIKESERRIKAGDNAVPALAELASLLYSNGYYSEAARCYQGLVRADPGDPRWPHLMANILAGFGQLDDAVILWRRALDLKGDYTAAQIHLADSLLKLNQPKAAEEVYDRVLKRESENAYALVGLARMDMEASRWANARSRLEMAVSASDYSIGYDLLVTACEHLGDTARAEAIRARAKASGQFIDIPDPWLRETYFDCYDSYQLSLAAGTAARQRDIPFGINLMERAITLDPKNGYYYGQVYQFYLQMKNPAKALQTLLKGAVEAPDCADVWHELALYYRNARQDQQSYRSVLTGLAHCPDSPSLHYMKGEYLMAAGKFEEAIPEFQQTASIKTDDGLPHLQLAQIYISLNRMSDGLAELDKALLAEPNFPPVLKVLSVYYINVHDIANARKWMQRVKDQPRILSKDRMDLENAFRQQFGVSPY